MLDLREHDPEDFEGQGVRIGGAAYELGPSAGSGVSKFVHVLRNRASGLCLSVLAIHRDSRSAPDSIAREQAARALDDLLGWNLVPNTMKISLPGGVGHMQDYAGPYEATHRPRVADGDRQLGKGRLERALGSYSRALADSPSHTVALNNRAHVLARLDRTGDAADDMARAVRIEPNYLPYLRNWVRYAAAAHRPTAVWDGYLLMREKFPYADGVGTLLDAVPRMARLLNNEATGFAEAGQWERATALAREAAETHERLAARDAKKYEAEQAVVLANLGRCVARGGDPAAAVRPLFRAMAIARTNPCWGRPSPTSATRWPVPRTRWRPSTGVCTAGRSRPCCVRTAAVAVAVAVAVAEPAPITAGRGQWTDGARRAEDAARAERDGPEPATG